MKISPTSATAAPTAGNDFLEFEWKGQRRQRGLDSADEKEARASPQQMDEKQKARQNELLTQSSLNSTK